MEKLGTTFTDWNGYTVFSDGTILNKDGSIKSFKTNSKGYLFTNFYYEGKLHTHVIQRVVWYAFKGEIPEGFEIDHINNCRKENAINNLQLLTKSENNQKAYDLGNRMFLFGQTNPNSKRRKNERTSSTEAKH